MRLADRSWSQPRNAGLIGRCLRERRPVIEGDAGRDADYTGTAGDAATSRSELVGAAVGGGHAVGRHQHRGDARPDAFDEDDARLVQTVADQVGSALRSATLYERLESAYVGHRGGAGRGAGGQGLLHRRATRARWWSGPQAVGRRLGLTGRRAADAALRRDLPRHRQDRGARGDPQQARAAHATPSAHEIKRHTIVRRADPVLGGLPRARAAAGAPRARALGRPRLPGRPGGRGDPAGLAHHPGLRRLRRDDQRPPLPRRR